MFPTSDSPVGSGRDVEEAAEVSRSLNKDGIELTSRPASTALARTAHGTIEILALTAVREYLRSRAKQYVHLSKSTECHSKQHVRRSRHGFERSGYKLEGFCQTDR